LVPVGRSFLVDSGRRRGPVVEEFTVLTRRNRSLVLLVCISLAGAAEPVALGQADIKRDPQLSAAAPALQDFIHFTRIGRYDAAASYARQLLDAKLPATKFVDLVEGSGEQDRFEEALGRAERIPDVESLVAQLRQLYTRGKLDRVRDPQEIKRNIALLTGIAQHKLLGRERLAAAGEYAVPQLLDALLQGADVELSVQAGNLLADMRSQSIIPLCTALPDLDPTGQEKVVDVLARIEYRTSAPFLADLRNSTKSDSVRRACDRALTRLGIGETSVQALYTSLADGYYRQKAELTSFPGEVHQILWTYKPQIGLFMTAIRTEVFHQAMAMRLCERSLTIQGAGNDPALALWLASNFSREIHTPQGYENPAYPSTRRDAMYFAVAAGAPLGQQVLGRALDDKDTPLARRAIAAIEKTAGGAALWGGGARRPLLEALQYPNRRVQYEAALALGSAQPSSGFDGSGRVVPILGSAIRDADARYAVVVTGDNEKYTTLRGVLTGMGYNVLPFGRTLTDLAEPISEAPGIDVIVADLSMEQTAALVSDARATRSLVVTPILAMTSAQGYLELGRQFSRDVTVAVRPQGLGQATIAEAVKDLLETASGGPISGDEARAYSSRCLAVLRDLAVSGNTVFSVADAALPLISALGAMQGPARLDVAEVLARIDQKRAQVAVMDAALNAAGPERIALLGKTADSAKRFGNKLEPRQVDRVIELASTGKGDEATAAAALVGSLNLSNSNLVPLILNQSK
jgi:HEAT repeat protein